MGLTLRLNIHEVRRNTWKAHSGHRKAIKLCSDVLPVTQLHRRYGGNLTQTAPRRELPARLAMARERGMQRRCGLIDSKPEPMQFSILDPSARCNLWTFAAPAIVRPWM
jgi:hypothetical protein